MSPQSLTFEKLIQASPRQAYRAFTNSTILRQWFCDVAFTEVKPGGRYYFAWNSGFYASGVFTEAVEPEQLDFNWLGSDEPAATHVHITIEASAGGVRLLVEHGGIGEGQAWQPVLEEMRTSWEYSLENLKAALETGEDLRLVRRPMLGITLGDFTAETAERLGLPAATGIRLDSVVSGMGAALAGLQKDDVVVGVAGKPVVNYGDLAAALQRQRAGDTVAVEFYRSGEKLTRPMTLSGRPIPQIPADPAELGRRLHARQAEIDAELDAFLSPIGEADASFKPAPGEWSIKEVLAHLIHSEVGSQVYYSDVLSVAEPYYNNFGSNRQERIDATLAAYPTLGELRQQLKRAAFETNQLLSNLSADFIAEHKSSYWNLAYGVLESPYHHRTHMEQMQAALAAAQAARQPTG
jgi:uncharacterized protein YndB with AHSA1/START domain